MKRTNVKRIGKSRIATFGFLAACAMTLSGLAGCTTTVDGDEEGGKVAEGEKTTMSISIPVVTTYADDDNAKSSEVAISTVDVYVYGTSLETHKSFVKEDFTLVVTGTGVPNRWDLKDTIEVLSGTKKIYVGINLPAAAKTVIQTGGGLQGLYALNPVLKDTISRANQFAMFSVNTTANTEFPIVAGVTDPRGTNQNVFSINVERWASKVTATKSSTLVDGVNNKASGVTFHPEIANGLKFCLGNINTELYPLQRIVGGYVEDPNHTIPASAPPFLSPFLGKFVDDFVSSDYLNATPTGYVDVDAHTVLAPDRNTKYAVENTSAAYYQGVLTYVSVRALFYPDNIATYDSTTNTLTPTPNSAVVNDLYVYTTAGGEYLYFTTQAEANKWIQDSNGAAQNEGYGTVGNYKNGYCFYLIYLDPQDVASATKKFGDYAVGRNLFYATNITKFNALGYPTPEEPNPNSPLSTKTLLTVNVEITNWSLVPSDHELGPL
jgi:hypothetical protein